MITATPHFWRNVAKGNSIRKPMNSSASRWTAQRMQGLIQDLLTYPAASAPKGKEFAAIDCESVAVYNFTEFGPGDFGKAAPISLTILCRRCAPMRVSTARCFKNLIGNALIFRRLHSRNECEGTGITPGGLQEDRRAPRRQNMSGVGSGKRG